LRRVERRRKVWKVGRFESEGETVNKRKEEWYSRAVGRRLQQENKKGIGKQKRKQGGRKTEGTTNVELSERDQGTFRGGEREL
jgi:hypothetical protein